MPTAILDRAAPPFGVAPAEAPKRARSKPDDEDDLDDRLPLDSEDA